MGGHLAGTAVKSADDFRVRRVGGNTASILRWLEQDEPRTSMLISELMHESAVPGRRAWVVADASGRQVAALVLRRECFDRWEGFVHLRDERAAPVLGRLVDSSPAVVVVGAADDVRPLADHVTRGKGILLGRWAVVDHPVAGILQPPTHRTRLAIPIDRDSIAAFLAAYEYVGVPTLWQLKSKVRSMIERSYVIVCEERDAIVGVFGFAGRSQRYLVGGDLSVAPEHRQTGVAWELVRHTQSLASSLGLGVSFVLAPSNPMAFDHPRVRWQPDHFHSLPLQPLRRFRGQSKLRSISRRIQPLQPRTPRLFADPRDPDRHAPTSGAHDDDHQT